LKKVLGKISIRRFEPKTTKTKKDVKRKIQLRNKIRASRSNLSQIRKNCENKKVSLKIIFHLSKERIEDESKYQKDIDNLLKIVLDVLPKFMDKGEKNKGLAIIDNDESVYEIKTKKVFVKKDVDQGIDIEISKAPRT
jgi:Holliday junction resolvase RusA-like endonuclease